MSLSLQWTSRAIVSREEEKGKATKEEKIRRPSAKVKNLFAVGANSPMQKDNDMCVVHVWHRCVDVGVEKNLHLTVP